MKEFQKLLKALSAEEPASSAASFGSSLPALTPVQIQCCLKRLLDDKAHVVDPALFQTASPLAVDANQGPAVFKTLQALRPLCLLPSGRTELTKPIVMIIPERTMVASRELKGQHSQAQGGASVVAWKAVVLLPPRYQTPDDKTLTNTQPLLYYFDAQTHQPQQLPQAVAQLGLAMSQGCAIPAVVQGRQAMVRMEPLFSRPQFFNASRIFCLEDAEATSWWAMFFVLTAVLTGRHEFDDRSIPSLLRLQQQLRSWTEEVSLVEEKAERKKELKQAAEEQPMVVNPPSAALQKAHHLRCVQTALARVAEFALQDPGKYRSLLEEIRRLTKFSLLIEQRKKYLPEQTDLAAHDQQIKALIYAQLLPDLKAVIMRFPLEKLLELLRLPVVACWFALLQRESQQKRLEVLRWEQDLKEFRSAQRGNWCDYFTQKVKEAGWFIYQYSWIGLSQSIVQGFAKAVLRDTTPSAKIQQSVAQIVDWPLSRFLGLLGAGLGVGLQWMLGPADLLRVLILVGSVQGLQRTLQSRQIREEKAEVVPMALSPMATLRLSQAVLSLVEVFLTGHYAPLIAAIGGMAGSTAALTTAQAVFPALASRSLERVEERRSVIFLIALVGSQLGQTGARLFYLLTAGIQQRLMHREVTLQLLMYLARDQNDLQSLRVETPPFRYSPSLWWSDRNPIRLEWTTRAGAARSMVCEIQSLPVVTPQGLVGVVCEELAPELSSVLSLPSP